MAWKKNGLKTEKKEEIERKSHFGPLYLIM